MVTSDFGLGKSNINDWLPMPAVSVNFFVIKCTDIESLRIKQIGRAHV